METFTPAVEEAQDIELLKSMCRMIEDHLFVARNRLNEEIRNYPTPIPRCDAQFNHLYERREGIVRDLDEVAALLATDSPREDYADLIRRHLARA